MQTDYVANRKGANICMLISSCDAYSDIWPAMSQTMAAHWPDCPFPRFLMSNYDKAPAGFTTLAIGPDISWSANLIRGLEMIDHDYVLLSVDDLLLTRKVDTHRLLESVCRAQRAKVAALQLVTYENLWRRMGKWDDGSAIRIPVGGIYRATAVFTLWDRRQLLKVLNPLENAWQFEYCASDRLDADSDVLVAVHNHFTFVNAIVKGKVTRSAYRLCEQKHYPLSASRPVMTAKESCAYGFLLLRASTFRFVPPGCRRAVKSAIQRAAFTVRELAGRRGIQSNNSGANRA
jgi:hypothetical protein